MILTRTLFACLFIGSAVAAQAPATVPRPIELHQMLVIPGDNEKIVALTLDACGGGYDEVLIRFLIERQIPATIFVTRRWITRYPAAAAHLNSHPQLFEIENHGARHVPAVIGPGRTVFGLPGSPDISHLKSEVLEGAQAVKLVTGTRPLWYRGAAAEYDRRAMESIEAMGFRIAGFSVNADEGATLSQKEISRRIAQVTPGDIIIAHMNRPGSDIAKGLAEGLETLLAQGYRFVLLRDAQVRRVSKPSAKTKVRSSPSPGQIIPGI